MQNNNVGLIIGVALGIASAAYIVLRTSAFAIFSIWPVVLPVLLGMVVGLFVGKLKFLPLFPKWVPIVAAVVLWPLAVIGPYALQNYRLQNLLNTVPIYPGGQLDGDSFTIIGGDDPGGHAVRHIVIANPRSPSEIISFYVEQMNGMGWTTQNPVRHVEAVFERRGRLIKVSIMCRYGGLGWASLTSVEEDLCRDSGSSEIIAVSAELYPD